MNEQLHDTYFWTPQEEPAMVMQINLFLTVAINIPSEKLPTPASTANTQRPAGPHCAEAPPGSDEPSPALPPHLGKKHEIEAKFSCIAPLHTKGTHGNRNTCTHSYSSACQCRRRTCRRRTWAAIPGFFSSSITHMTGTASTMPSTYSGML